MKIYDQISEVVVFSCLYDHIRSKCSGVLPQTYTWLILLKLWDNSRTIASVVAIIIANATLIGLCMLC